MTARQVARDQRQKYNYPIKFDRSTMTGDLITTGNGSDEKCVEQQRIDKRVITTRGSANQQGCWTTATRH